MNEINNKLYNALNHYQNNEPRELYKHIYTEIANAVIDLLVRGVLKDFNKDNELIETLREFYID